MLCLNNIAKKYKDKIALEHVSLELDNGIYGLLGPNGAGKSTLMNIITGNIKPSDGQVLWDGHDIKILGSKYRSIIGYALKGIPKKDMSREIDRVLEYVNMTEEADRAIGTYSGGMKQRILIAQAVLGNPKLIVLDEPTVGLDPKERVRIRERISELAGDKVILVSTHVVSDIEPIAGEVILIKSGSIIDKDTVGNLCSKYGNVNGLEELYMTIFEEAKPDA